MRISLNRIEGKLLTLVSLIMVLGFVLVFLAKLPEIFSKGTNINTCSASELASRIGVDRSIADIVITYRKINGRFQNTYELTNVRLLTNEQVKKLSGKDLSKLSSTDIARMTGISEPIANTLLKSYTSMPSSIASSSSLSRIPALNDDILKKAEKRIKVREAWSVIVQFWLYCILVISGFLIMHAILRRNNPSADPYILPCVMMLAGISMMLMFSLKDPLRDTFIFPIQAQGMIFGLFAFYIPLSPWYRQLRPWRYIYIYAILSIIIILILALFGTGPGGSRLRLFGLQPVEIVKVLLAYFVASYLADRWIVLSDRSAPTKKGLRIPLFRDIGPLLVMYILSLATFLLVRDLGPMLILFGMFIFMLYISTDKISFMITGLLIITVTGIIAYWMHLGVFHVRVDMWLHPWNNKHPNGMQLGQALWGLASGGIWGSGLGLGQPDLMPRAGSDLIFAAAGEELGLLGSLIIICLFGIVIARASRTAIRARNGFQQLIVMAVTSLLAIQTIAITFGVLGLIPLTGVTLPFVSYGRSSLAASFFIIGLILGTTPANKAAHPASSIVVANTAKKLCTGIFILLFVVAGIGRLIFIQGVRADAVAGRLIYTPDEDGIVRAHVNPRLKNIEASIPRGSIYDRNGEILATSRTEEFDSGVYINNHKRFYPLGEAAAHITGYLDPLCGGPTGIERRYNNYLRGFDNYSELLPLYRNSHLPFSRKIVGNDIYLTIDSSLQKALWKSLRKHVAAIKDKRTGDQKCKAAAVVIDVRTGDVLAAVSLPSFDPNALTKDTWKVYNKDNERAPLLNRALYGYYPPGSVFKLVTASAALESGEDFICRCHHRETNIIWHSNGRTFSRRQITDLEEMQPHGITDLAKAIRASCNIYFAKLGIKLGPQKLHDMMIRYCLSKVPPSDKLAEDLPDNAYGQGIIQITPIEMAQVAAAIANDGIMMKPNFLKQVIGQTITKVNGASEKAHPISQKNAAVLRKMMADVVKTGTAQGLFDGLGVSVAGKTGSAENDRADKMPHSWFVGFAPVEDPKIAFAVVVENGGYGRSAAGPVCRDIIKAAFK